ncbi:hypothetical protein FOZ60_012184 [Perkinsus olseni]|uniref:Uncharacterized protein n=1 Tax=Perkinsus olseni TaxID=32597 RepID=A0A7J6P9W4_PEROL|nr:hypothetical protein FOZ60_012184 [Perkinsus olseni]
MTYSLTSDDDERYHNARGFLYETNKLMRENSETDLLSYQNALIHEKVGPLVRTSFGVGVLMGVRPDGTAEVQLQTLKMYPRLTDDNRPQWLKITQPFAAGGLAGSLATCVIQPVDMIKVRIQIAEAGATRSPVVIARNIIANEGFLSLYKGLDAGIVRQLTYTTTRLGVFRLTSMSLQSPHEKTLPFWKKGVAGLFAGGVGAFVGTPADLSLVRLQADATLPPAERRNYKGVFDAMSQIVKARGSDWSVERGKEYFSHLMGPGWGSYTNSIRMLGLRGIGYVPAV